VSAAAVRQIAAQAALPEAAVETALEWLVLVWSREATPAELDALDRWRAAHPDHERAWRRVQQLDDRLASVPGSIAAGSLRAADRAMSRRRFLRAVGLVAVGGAAAYGLRHTTLAERHVADLRTPTGEIRALTLADGTRLTLNTASAVNVRFADAERRLILVAGEILVASAPDASAAGEATPQPLVIETADGGVRPIGTRFTVRRTGARTEVAVLEGAVRISPRDAELASARIDAGRRAGFTTAAIEHLPAARAAAAWADGLLVAEQMRLGDLLDELGRYRTGVIRCQPEAAKLRVSGTFPVTDTDRALAALSQALPIRISSISRYWVTVEAR